MLTKNEIAERLGVTIVTVDRWILNGLFTSDGKRVKLITEKKGRRVYVSPEDFAEFMKVREGLR